MTPERWQQIERLYHLAAGQEVSQRATFLDEACHGDEAMRQEIESLLAHEEPANQFMEAPGMAVLAQAVAQDRAGSMIGRQLGAYQILSLLGAGGMGEVYQARDTRLGRLVALKILPGGVAADPDRKRRFLQEAKAASALNHPHIVTLHDVGSEEGVDFLVMEYVQGNTLDKLIPRGGLDLTKALRYAIEIADAFAKAHAAGIIHRDLKPGNIMVTEDGAVKVLDFGIAKLTETLESSEPAATVPTRTATEGTILGTAAYMSPEQAEGKKVDGRSDIFSFGALLYEMVTGRRAFQGDSKLSTLSAVLREEPKPASEVVEGLPRELERIIARCLRKRPERRFQTMADLKVALEELKEESDAGTINAAPARARRRDRRLVWILTLLAIIAVGGTLWFIRRAREAPEPALTAVPLTTYPGFEADPSFSPDGNQVAFTWDGEKRDNDDIYVKLIGTGGPPLRLTTDPAPDFSPAWSPDGRFIAFLRELSPEKSAVLLIPALGGPERKLAAIFTPEGGASTGVAGAPTGVPSPFLEWSPDGNWVVISDRGSPREPTALYLLSTETGERRKLTSPPVHSLGDSCPAFSPDGRALVFSRDVDTPVGELYLLALSGGLKPEGEPRQLTQGNRGFGRPAWTPDGRAIVFSFGAFGEPGLWRIDATGSVKRPSEPQRLASLGANVSQPVISRHGRRLAYTHNVLHWNIWRMPAAGSQGPRSATSLGPVDKPAPFISSTRDDESPQFSADGKRLAFVSDRSGNSEIWVCGSDGSNAVQLTSFGGAAVTTPRWSPDGEQIAFDSNAAGEFDIWVVGAGGGKPQRMTIDPANDGDPSWSHDGQWIYFDSARGGAQQVWKIPAHGGEAIQVTRDGGFAPLESPDGKSLYYVKSLTVASLWKMPVQGGQAIKILEGLSSYINLALVPTGIYFVPERNATHTRRLVVKPGSSIEFLNFRTGQIRTVANVEKGFNLGAGAGGLAVSPDGRWILYTQFEQAGSELMLVEKFR